MRFGALEPRAAARKTSVAALALALPALLVPAATASAARSGNNAATISGSFGDGCREFTAHSSKDISHVEIHYADGRVVKDETVDSPEYATDGGAREEIEFAVAKSGTTRETFVCPRTNSPPTALLEVLTPDSGCGPFWDSGLQCVQWVPRTAWRSSADFPTEPGSYSSQEAGNLLWLCDRAFACPFTFDLRATGSSDPDGDITSWSIGFGDGASASGSWSADPPASVAHAYALSPFTSCADPFHVCVTLTVTDAAGQSDSDTITMGFIDVTPD